MGDRNGPNRRRYLRTVGGSLGILAFSGNASAQLMNKNRISSKKTQRMANRVRPNEDFDPHSIDEVRDVNIKIRRMSRKAIEQWSKKLSERQKEAIADSNRVTSKITKYKMTFNGQEQTIRVDEESDDSIAKKWGWDE